MSNDTTKVAERPLTPLVPEYRPPVDGAAYRAWLSAVLAAVAQKGA